MGNFWEKMLNFGRKTRSNESNNEVTTFVTKAKNCNFVKG